MTAPLQLDEPGRPLPAPRDPTRATRRAATRSVACGPLVAELEPVGGRVAHAAPLAAEPSARHPLADEPPGRPEAPVDVPAVAPHVASRRPAAQVPRRGDLDVRE